MSPLVEVQGILISFGFKSIRYIYYISTWMGCSARTTRSRLYLQASNLVMEQKAYHIKACYPFWHGTWSSRSQCSSTAPSGTTCTEVKSIVRLFYCSRVNLIVIGNDIFYAIQWACTRYIGCFSLSISVFTTLHSN